MTDEELDRDWKPNGRRPQSTIARVFSQELMDIFRIEESVADLDEKVDKRKQQLNSQTSELEALEARIREMEARLKSQQVGSIDSSLGRPNGSTSAPPRPAANAPPPPPEKEQHPSKYGGSRPGTARQSQQAVPGALPPTPVGSEGECEPVVTPRAPRLPPARSSRSGHGQGPSSAFTYPSSPSATAATTVPAPRAQAHVHHGRQAQTSGDDSASVKSLSSSQSFADYVIVPGPDGDRERDA